MLHFAPMKARAQRRLVTRQRFNLAGSLLLVTLLPLPLRELFFPGSIFLPSSVNSLIVNAAAVIIAFWIRLSIDAYPGNRMGKTILPAISAGYGLSIAVLLMTRLPYDRFALIVGAAAHLMWSYGLYALVHRGMFRRIAIVPFGAIETLETIKHIHWVKLPQPDLDLIRDCDAIVADFAAPDLPDEWEAFLADAALAGKVVYQVKQLSESLTGRVEIEHLSENSFGSLVPARGYFYLKALVDFLVALTLLPLALLVMALVAIAIRLDGPGSIYFRQKRVGHAGKPITVLKFRTMRAFAVGDDDRVLAVTKDGDDRITRVGGFLRRSRLDELPQIINILKGEMSWIGPRPEASVLSTWYTGEIPFYRYRHVVKPGISGWAQVNQGHVAGVDEVHRKLQYDFYYIKYFSPWLDSLIAFSTVRTILTGFGSR
jgi:lipopolysaccharide/colanic/teichoic acid biosynthesis glycosyltransferase